MRKKPRFTHGRGYFRGDVSGKRFSTHVAEGNVADIAQERLSDGTGDTVTEHPSRGTVTGYCHRTPITGYRHRVLARLNITAAYNRVDVGSYPQHLSLHRTYGSRIRRYIHIGERKL